MREKITWTWQKIVTLVLGLLGIGTLTSCYGMPTNINPYKVQGKLTLDHDKDPSTPSIAVKNAKVEFSNLPDYANDMQEYCVSDSDGSFYLLADLIENLAISPDPKDVLEITITDVDGEENGSFKTKKVEVPVSSLTDYETDIGTVELEAE